MVIATRTMEVFKMFQANHLLSLSTSEGTVKQMIKSRTISFKKVLLKIKGFEFKMDHKE